MRNAPVFATFEHGLEGARRHRLGTDTISEVHVTTLKPQMEHVQSDLTYKALSSLDEINSSSVIKHEINSW